MSPISDYRMPQQSATMDTKAGWLRETIQAGQQWLRSQRAYPSIAEARDLILSVPEEQQPKDLSKIRIPRTKRQIRELVSIMANLKPTAANKTDNAKFYDTAEIFNKMDRWWWFQTFFDRRLRQVFQRAAVDGTGYASHVWDPDFFGKNRGDIRTDVYGADQVYLIQPPADHDLQECYAVFMKRRVAIWKVQAKYPMMAHMITPDHGASGWTQKGLDYVQSFGFRSSPLKHLTGPVDDEDPDRDSVWPTCDIYEGYITDLSMNMTGSEVTMGRPGSSWEYKVPAFGSEIPTGTNGWEGTPLYKKANEDDAQLYPMRRKIVATGNNLILYDDTSEWWHGKVPLARFTFDDWPTEALGFSLVRDVMTIEDDANQLLRGISDAARIRLDPPLQYDENLVSEGLAARLNTRLPRQRLKGNLSMGDMIKPLLPANYADLPNYIPDVVKFLFEQGDFIIGVRDLLAITKAKQIPSADSLEKIMEMAGPLAQDMTRGMEMGMRDLGEQRRWFNLQFRSARRRLELFGDDGTTKDDFDYDPGNLVPSHMEGEDPEKESKFSQLERAKRHAGAYEYRVVPNSMARLQQMGAKLLLLQLEGKGFPLDPWTKAELFEVDGFGPPPINEETGEQCNTILERWVAFQHMLRELAEEGGQPQQPQKGRPASGNRSPQLKQKSGNRSTVQQSR